MDLPSVLSDDEWCLPDHLETHSSDRMMPTQMFSIGKKRETEQLTLI